MKSRPTPLKVALICITDPHSGGAVSYERDVVHALTSEPTNEYEFIVFLPKDSSSLDPTSIGSQRTAVYKSGLLALLLMSIRLSLPGYAILKRVGLRYGRLEREMKKQGVSLAYFLSPNPLALDLVDTPMMNTVWDLGHRDLPEFLEITGDRHYEERELFFSRVLPKSFQVFVDTDETATKITQYYGVNPSRICPTGLIFNMTSERASSLPVTSEFDDRPFFLYPAQLWPHKRHVLLLNAFAEVRKTHPDSLLIFTGSDKGNRAYLETVSADLGLTQSVHFLGFVSEDRLNSLMRHAQSLVFPSSLGPSNLPPLEAAALGTPSLISSVHHDPALENALITVVSTQSVAAWADAMNATFEYQNISRTPAVVLTRDVKQIVSQSLRAFSESRSEWC